MHRYFFSKRSALIEGLTLTFSMRPFLDGLAVDRLRQAMRQHDAVDLLVVGEEERDGARRGRRHRLHAPAHLLGIGPLTAARRGHRRGGAAGRRRAGGGAPAVAARARRRAATAARPAAAATATVDHHARPHFLVLQHQRHVRLLVDEDPHGLRRASFFTSSTSALPSGASATAT